MAGIFARLFGTLSSIFCVLSAAVLVAGLVSLHGGDAAAASRHMASAIAIGVSGIAEWVAADLLRRVEKKMEDGNV